MELFKIAYEGAGPLQFDYPITPLVSVHTTVSGKNRNVAVVSIEYVGMTMWSATLMQTAPKASPPPNLQIGDLTIINATFSLTVPSPSQNGMVMMSTVLQMSGQEPVGLNAPVAVWTYCDD